MKRGGDEEGIEVKEGDRGRRGGGQREWREGEEELGRRVKEE